MGLAVGLVVIVGSLMAKQVDGATVAIAIVLGIGLVLYGPSAMAGALRRREPGGPWSAAGLVVSAVAVVVGVSLVLRANAGSLDYIKSVDTDARFMR